MAMTNQQQQAMKSFCGSTTPREQTQKFPTRRHNKHFCVCSQLRGGPRARTIQPISTANRGLITSSMIASRSSNGMNADFIALMVKRARSLQP
jgi:hypothetical protein